MKCEGGPSNASGRCARAKHSAAETATVAAGYVMIIAAAAWEVLVVCECMYRNVENAENIIRTAASLYRT